MNKYSAVTIAILAPLIAAVVVVGILAAVYRFLPWYPFAIAGLAGVVCTTILLVHQRRR
jgi:hypothetical protein